VISRRKFLKRGGQVGATIAAASAVGPAFARIAGHSNAEEIGGPADEPRAQRAFEIRCDSARAAGREKNPIPTTNGDEERYPDKRVNFAKSLPHNELGEVEPQAYSDWLSILASGDPGQFERVPRDPVAVAKLNDPQATYAFDLVGIDSHATRLPPPPNFRQRQDGGRNGGTLLASVNHRCAISQLRNRCINQGGGDRSQRLFTSTRSNSRRENHYRHALSWRDPGRSSWSLH
jgi:hypothetical protein